MVYVPGMTEGMSVEHGPAVPGTMPTTRMAKKK